MSESFRALLRLEVLKNELECLQKSSEHRRSSFSNVSYRKKNDTDVSGNINNISNSNDIENSHSWMNSFKLKRPSIINEFGRTKRHQFRKLNDIKLAFSEFYLMIILLKNYQTLNYTGFRKILKKHDKLFETTRGNEWRYDYFFLLNYFINKI
jgi:hypothetical protein